MPSNARVEMPFPTSVTAAENQTLEGDSHAVLLMKPLSPLTL